MIPNGISKMLKLGNSTTFLPYLVFGIFLTAGGCVVLAPKSLHPTATTPPLSSVANSTRNNSRCCGATPENQGADVKPLVETVIKSPETGDSEGGDSRVRREAERKSRSNKIGRSKNSVTISVGVRHMGMNLSGSSSSPVEPIKPLLELGVGEEGAPLIVPPHPVFDEATPKNISGLAGNSAYLHCIVHNLANKSVSWIRQRDLHILTVGRYTYTTDERYEVIHSKGSKDWILKIKYAQVRDSGYYECQVSTKPVRTYVVKLNIFAPHAEIIGSPDMHVDKGSTINLTCIIAHSAEPPSSIFWYHNGKIITYDSPRGGITSVTERSNTTTGYLLIQNAQPADSGNYSCTPSNTASTSLRVHVLNGESPEAVQTNGGEGTFILKKAQWAGPMMIFASCFLSYLWQVYLLFGLGNNASKARTKKRKKKKRRKNNKIIRRNDYDRINTIQQLLYPNISKRAFHKNYYFHKNNYRIQISQLAGKIRNDHPCRKR